MGAIINLLSHVKMGGKSVDPENYTVKTRETRKDTFALVELMVEMIEETAVEGCCSVVTVLNTAAKSLTREVLSFVRYMSVIEGTCANTMSTPLVL